MPGLSGGASQRSPNLMLNRFRRSGRQRNRFLLTAPPLWLPDAVGLANVPGGDGLAQGQKLIVIA